MSSQTEEPDESRSALRGAGRTPAAGAPEEESMTFEISHERRGALPIFRVSGELDIATAPQLKSMVASVLETGARSIAFDFSRLSFIDSCGLAVLMHAQKRVVERGGQVYITGAFGHTRRIFSLLNLGRIFRFCDEAELPTGEPGASDGSGAAAEEVEEESARV